MNNSSSIVRPSRSRQRNMVNVVNIDSLASLDWCEGSSWLGPDTTQGNCNEDHRMKIDRDLTKPSKFGLALLCLLLASTFAGAQQRRKVIINQDCSGPGGSNMQTLLLLIQSPEVEVLGITVVSGNQWRDEEVAHTLRLLEIIGRTDIPVVPGAVFPLVRQHDETQLWQQRYGKVAFAGAWDERWWHEPFVVPPLPEGQPAARQANE